MNNERLMVMRNKIENVGLEDCGVDGGLVAEIIDELIDSRFQIESLTAERDEARKEIAELRSAPGMEEVDFITKPYCGQSMQSTCENHNKLADTARRAIASRDAEKKRADETAELLKWLAEKSENWSSFAFAAEADSTESLGKVRRIIKIVEGM